MTYTLTAADYTYMDRAEKLYQDTKTFIASHDSAHTDRFAKRRPGIPGTIDTLNERVGTLIELHQFGVAARLIEKKVRKAYKLDGSVDAARNGTDQ